MKKKFSFDIHGVLDDLPETFVALNSALYKAGHEIHIVTGITQSEEVLKEIWDLGMRWHKFFSIVDYHKSIGTEIVWGSDGRPWIDRETWNVTKSWYCEKHAIDMHFDDTQAYEPYFKTPFARVWTKNNRNGRGTKPTETALMDLHDVYLPWPWSQDQVHSINSYQKRGKYPALSCHNCGRELYAVMDGLLCMCGYRQTWIHKFRAALTISDKRPLKFRFSGGEMTVEVVKKEYKNLIEFATETGTLEKFTEEVGPSRSLEDYLDDYSDRDIVNAVLNDHLDASTDKYVKVGRSKDPLKAKITIK